MKIFELLRNPLIKTAGIILVIYFALFDNKENPNSLGNRLSADRVKQNFEEAREKSQFIVANVKKAQQIAKERELEQNGGVKKIENPITVEDLEIGTGEEEISCGDQTEISYGLYTKSGKQLEFFNPKTLVIGSRENQIIEKNIIGMKLSGVRNINIPSSFNSTDKNDWNIMELIRFHNSNLRYQITLLSLQKASGATISCD